MPTENSTSSTPKAMATSFLCQHRLVSRTTHDILWTMTYSCGRRSGRPPQLDKEAEIVAHCLYGHLYSHVSIPKRCRIFRGKAHFYLYWHIHHDDQQRHWCHVSSIRMVDDFLASSCATVRQATGVSDFVGCLSCGPGSCTDVSIFWDLSGN